MKNIICILFCFLSALGTINAAGPLNKSDKLVPKWVKQTPKGDNPNIAYRVVQVYVDNLSDMPNESLKELANYFPQEWGIRTGSARDMQKVGVNESQLIVEIDSYQGNAEQVPMRCKLVDSYWEKVQMGYQNKYRCYVLYQVKNPDASAYAEEWAHVTERYGFAPGVISIIPGAGQMYKGDFAKGISFLVVDVVCASGIVLCECTRAAYSAKITQQPQYAQQYSTRANNWSTGRNICIGVTAAIWLGNIIDAFAAKGARRVIAGSRTRYFSMNPCYQLNPITNTMDTGVGIAYHF